jgi:hypothetical protein
MCSVKQWLWVNTKEPGGPWQLDIGSDKDLDKDTASQQPPDNRVGNDMMEEGGGPSFAWQQRHGRPKETDNVDTQQATGNSADNELNGLSQGSGASPQQIMQVADFLPELVEYIKDAAGPPSQGAQRVSRTFYWCRMECRVTAMLDGIWPGLDNQLLLFRFISRHFDECYNSYFSFLMWRYIKLAESPGAYLHVRDWQRANTMESGASRQLDNIGDNFVLQLM